MRSRAEVTTGCAKAYVTARKKGKGRVLNEVVSMDGVVQGQRAAAADRGRAAVPGQRTRGGRADEKASRARVFVRRAKVLQRVWAASGGQCGKYLAASMHTQLDALERHDELVPGQDRYSTQVRAELLGMSAATVWGHVLQAPTVRRRKSSCSREGGERAAARGRCGSGMCPPDVHPSPLSTAKDGIFVVVPKGIRRGSPAHDRDG